MKFLIPLILMGMISGCALQQDLDDLRFTVNQQKTKIEELKLQRNQDLREIFTQLDNNSKDIEFIWKEIDNLKEIKSFEDLEEVKKTFDKHQNAILILAGKFDDHAEALIVLGNNDQAIKTLLEKVRDVLVLMDLRQDLHEAEGSH